MDAPLVDRLGGAARRSISAPPFFTLALVVVALAMLKGRAGVLLFLAILVPTMLLVVVRPQRGVLIFAALIPFNGLLIIAGTPSWVGGWKEAFLGALLVLTFVCPPEARGPAGRRLPGWFPAVVGLFVLGLLSAATVGGVTAMTGLRISYFNILGFVVIWRCPLSRQERDALVSIFVGVAIITSVVGIWQQMVGHAQLASMGYKYNETIRFTSGFRLRSFSTFNQPFPFAFYLMLAMLIATPFSLSDPGRLRSKIYFISLPLLASALVLTYVRAAWLGLGLGLLYLAFHRYKLMVYGIPLVLVGLLFLPGGTSSFTRAAFQSESLKVRTTSWNDRFGVLLDHPFGTGIGTTGAAAEKSLKLHKDAQVLAFQPDNAYLKVAFELGVLGLWLFVLLLVAAFRSAREVERRCHDPDAHFAAGVSAQILAIAAASTVSTYFEMIPMDALFWIMLGALATMSPLLKPGPVIEEAQPEPVEVPPLSTAR